jgi:WD40 repeat protein
MCFSDWRGITIYDGRTSTATGLQIPNQHANRQHISLQVYQNPEGHPHAAILWGGNKVVPAVWPPPPQPSPMIAVIDLETGRTVSGMTVSCGGRSCAVCLKVLESPPEEPVLLAVGTSDGLVQVLEANTGRPVTLLSDPLPLAVPRRPPPPPQVGPIPSGTGPPDFLPGPAPFPMYHPFDEVAPAQPSVLCITSYRTPSGETRVAAGHIDGVVKIYDLTTRAKVGELVVEASPQHVKTITSYTGLTGDQRIVAVYGENTLRVSLFG